MKIIFYILLLSVNLGFSQNFNKKDINIGLITILLKLPILKKKSIINTSKSEKILGKSNITLDYYINKHNIFQVIPVFNKNESYLEKNKTIKETLKHEQVHFDILELFARKIRQQLIMAYEEMGDIEKDVFLDIYNTEINKYLEFDKLYDIQTSNSNFNIEQEKWNKKIKIELKKLDKYSLDNYKKYFANW